MTTAADVYRQYSEECLREGVPVRPTHGATDAARRATRTLACPTASARPHAPIKTPRAQRRHVAQVIFAGPWPDHEEVVCSTPPFASSSCAPVGWASTGHLQAAKVPASARGAFRRPPRLARTILVYPPASAARDPSQRGTVSEGGLRPRAAASARPARRSTAPAPAVADARRTARAALAPQPRATRAAVRPASAPLRPRPRSARPSSAVQDPVSVRRLRAASRARTREEAPLVQAHCARTALPTAAARHDSRVRDATGVAHMQAGLPLARMRAALVRQGAWAPPRGPERRGTDRPRPAEERTAARTHAAPHLWSCIERGALH